MVDLINFSLCHQSSIFLKSYCRQVFFFLTLPSSGLIKCSFLSIYPHVAIPMHLMRRRLDNPPQCMDWPSCTAWPTAFITPRFTPPAWVQPVTDKSYNWRATSNWKVKEMLYCICSKVSSPINDQETCFTFPTNQIQNWNQKQLVHFHHPMLQAVCIILYWV